MSSLATHPVPPPVVVSSLGDAHGAPPSFGQERTQSARRDVHLTRGSPAAGFAADTWSEDMIPRLLELAWLMSHRNVARRQTPAADACEHTIDGMLFVGVRPAAHHAA
jgi:hypothetical protein